MGSSQVAWRVAAQKQWDTVGSRGPANRPLLGLDCLLLVNMLKVINSPFPKQVFSLNHS